MEEKDPEPMKDLDLDLHDEEKGGTGQDRGMSSRSRPPTKKQILSQKGLKGTLDQSSSKDPSPVLPTPPPTRDLSTKSSSRLGTTHSEEPRLDSGSPDGKSHPRKNESRTCPQSSKMSSREELVAKAESSSSGPEGWPNMSDQNDSCIPSNIRHKFGSLMVDQLVTEEQARRAIYEMTEGQKEVSSREHKYRNSMESSPFADYYELGFNMRSNIFQGVLTGPPMKTTSLMKDSYTMDVVERAESNTKPWHGRKTDDFGRWHQKNFLDMNLQKALLQKMEQSKK
ncbi:ciliary microtubule inner protein 4 isoform X2 [Macrotis lagotis]|uniref:ciliary microtubule inner protein 4 isoform X2 n=1 Tax=Macrotis lagotis TaxID=92651 RepID=UPI003D68C042